VEEIIIKGGQRSHVINYIEKGIVVSSMAQSSNKIINLLINIVHEELLKEYHSLPKNFWGILVAMISLEIINI